MGILGRLGMSSETSLVFAHLEVSIKHLLGIRQTDYIAGHFALWIPSLMLAFIAWIPLRVFDRTRIVQRFLRTPAGMITVAAPPLYWLSWWWPYPGALIEAAVSLLVMAMVSTGKWRIPWWAMLSFLAAHYAYWYFSSDSLSFLPGYAGPTGPVLGFCSGAVWCLYIFQLSRAPGHAPAGMLSQ
jgi:hypothetical protein